MKIKTFRKHFYGFMKDPATIAFLIAAVAVVPAMAQSPFTAPITAIETFAMQVARVVGVVVLVFGGIRLAMGGHRSEGVMEMLFGLAMSAYAPQLVTWLFP